MYKKLLALSLALVLCACPAFAVSDAVNSYYDFEPISYGSLGVRALSTVTGWTDTDHDYLNQIRLALTQTGTGTIGGSIINLLSNSDKILDKLFDIKASTDYLRNINNNSNSVVSLLQTDLKGSDILALLKASNLDKIAKDSTVFNGLFVGEGYPRLAAIYDQMLWYLPRFSSWLSYDGTNPDEPYNPTLYHFVKNLSDTLASEDDRALAESQKANREKIEQDFVSGSSGKTSLGASDFGDLSSVGGSVNDSLSLNGQSSISGFIVGLSDSDAVGQGWFSAETRDALDSVSTSSSYGLKCEKGNSDIYNMAGFAEHYSWLYGE